MIVGDAHVVEEDLVEARPTGHLAQRPDLDSGRPHVDDEAGQALVLGLLGIGAGDDLADVGVLRPRRPHLLAVEHPLVAVALGSRLQAGEVAPGAGLGEQLAGDDVAAPQRPQVALLRRHRGVSEDRRGDHPEADEEWALVGDVVAGLDRVVGRLERLVETAAAELGRAGDPAEAGVEAGLPERPRRGDDRVLLLTRPFLEHRHVVRALTPHELAVGVASAGRWHRGTASPPP